jgi:hypothetical protein
VRRINLRANLTVVVFLLVGVISLLLSGCGSAAGAASPTFSVPTGGGSTTKAGAANVTVSVVPSVSTVNPGSNFDVAVNVSTDVPARGFQCSLTWDPTKVTCNSVEQGSFFTSFAQQNNIMVQLMPGNLAADNKIGKFPPGIDPQGTILYNQAVFLMGGDQASDSTYPGPKGNGDIFIFHMTALPNTSGTVDFKLANVEVDNNHAKISVMNSIVNNGKITISSTK